MEANWKSIRIVLAILAAVFIVLSIFTQLPLWIGVLCLCVAVLFSG